MKILILIISLVLLDGCQTLATVASEAGKGLQQSSQNNKRVNCTTTVYGNRSYTTCQ